MERLHKVLEAAAVTHVCSVTIFRNSEAVFSYNPELVLPSASMGKIFILGYLSHLAVNGELNLGSVVHVEEEDFVSDSGLIQYLSARDYTYNDLASFVGAVSDNSATNTLIRVLGLNNIQKYGETQGMKHTGILDRIRDLRDPKIHAYAPSQSNSFEYAQMVEHFKTDALVRKWLSRNTDLSMVASAFNIDPLAHTDSTTLFNKTGTDYGVRCDAGNITINGNNYTYSMFVKFDESDSQILDETYSLMRHIGEIVKTLD